MQQRQALHHAHFVAGVRASFRPHRRQRLFIVALRARQIVHRHQRSCLVVFVDAPLPVVLRLQLSQGHQGLLIIAQLKLVPPQAVNPAPNHVPPRRAQPLRHAQRLSHVGRRFVKTLPDGADVRQRRQALCLQQGIPRSSCRFHRAAQRCIRLGELPHRSQARPPTQLDVPRFGAVDGRLRQHRVQNRQARLPLFRGSRRPALAKPQRTPPSPVKRRVGPRGEWRL